MIQCNESWCIIVRKERKGENLEMKRRLFMSLALALVLITLAPTAAMAAKPASFDASGYISDISVPDQWQAGKSDRWVVVERQISGTLFGDIGGEVGTDFTMTYRGNFDVNTQAGTFHGTVDADSYVLKVDGRVLPLEMVEWAPNIFLPKLTISGRWSFTEGTKGQGALDAWAIFIPTPDGHVGPILASEFTVEGKWQ